jgi:hypothetical protein
MSAAMDMRNDLKRDIRALWCRLRSSAWSFGRGATGREPSHGPAALSPLRSGRSDAGTPRAVLPVVGQGPAAEAGTLLQFPLHGEALLIKLAELLRRRIASRVASREIECDPLLLTVSRCPGSRSRCPGSRSRCPGSRLSIDRCTYVEFDADRCAYRVTIEATSDTTVTLDTTDFDAVVSFVVQYIAERPTERSALEMVAS